MRILMLTQFFQPEPIFKGLPFARELKSRGHDVQVLTAFPNYPGGNIYPGFRQQMWKREKMENIDVLRVPIYPSHDNSGLRRALNYLSFGATSSAIGVSLTKRVDVVYAYNLVTLAPALARLRWLSGAKTVLDVQDLWPESVASSSMMRSPFLSSILKYCCKKIYAAQDHLIALSPGFKQKLIERGVPEDKISVIHNWCDEASLSSSVHLPSSSKTDNRFKIVFAGTMGIMQALDTVIETADAMQSSHPNVLFQFVGSGIEVRRLKEKSKHLPNVEFIPAVPQSEIGKFLSAADALLVHLRNDPIFEVTIPSKIQAYMHIGKPILCGVRGDAATLVRQAKAGICFEPQDVDSLRRAVSFLTNTSIEFRNRMGTSGHNYYQKHLSFRCGIDAIESVFQTLFIDCKTRRQDGLLMTI